MRSPFSLGIGVAILALSVSASPALAHHGWSGNLDEEFQISGTVESGVSLAGPHATMKIRAEGQIWDLTLAPPPRTQAAGLKEGVIPVGATVTIHGHRNRDPKRFEIKTERVTWNGRTFNVYPDRK
ncbi:MAG: hypothetical protein DMG12_08000 [Acidobacteria bacterium]|nr:MAG: hypothetical protein DMG12_08000 [Acidobacteriota bacterium]